MGDELVKYGAEGGYRERDDFVPRATDHYKTVLTAGTAGFAEGRIEEMSPVFEVAKARDLETAKRALDPDDPTPANLVVLPQPERVSSADPTQEARDRVAASYDRQAQDPVVVGGPTEAQRQAAEDNSQGASTTDGNGGQGGTRRTAARASDSGSAAASTGDQTGGTQSGGTQGNPTGQAGPAQK